MIKQAISPLRRRMIEDMEIRGFAAKTQRGYIRAVRDFTAFLDRSPDQATAEDLRRHQLEMPIEGSVGDLDQRGGLGLAVLLQRDAGPRRRADGHDDGARTAQAAGRAQP